MQYRNICAGKQGQQLPLAQQKTFPDPEIVLHRAGDIHGEANQGLPICREQLPLPENPLFPVLQYLHKGGFPMGHSVSSLRRNPFSRR